MQSKGKPRILPDADIASQCSISRRSLPGIVAIGATAVAVVTAATVPGAEAAKLKGKTQDKKARDWLCCIEGIKGESTDKAARRRPRVRAK